MPLPKDYFDLIDRERKSNTANKYNIYRQFDEEPTREPGTMYDALGATLWGAASGLTWGVSENLVPYGETWEEMSDAERAGWVIGEGMSLFAPWGPFGLMGKASRGVARAYGNKFIDEAAEAASEAGTAALSNETIRSVAKAGGAKKIKFSDNINKALQKSASDDIGIQWVKDLAVTGKAGRDAADNLILSGRNAIIKAFDDTGVEIFARDADKIARNFVEEIAEGRYVNDIAEWAERGLRGVAPSATRNLAAKYFGMATQDLALMGVHGMISAKMKALANGEDFDAMGTLSHSGIMALGFPLVRAIPGGGMDRMGTGIKALFGSYRDSNYAAIRSKHGDEVISNLVRAMLSGSKLNKLNSSKLADASWRIPGQRFTNGHDVLTKLEAGKITTENQIKLLEAFRTKTNSEFMSAWGSKYAADLAKSMPRMAVGVVAMNPWILEKGAWNQMGSAELGSHLFMSALMTKGRGAWGHKDQRAYFSDFTPYKEVLHTLNVDTDNVKKVLQFHEARLPVVGMGASILSDKGGAKIQETVDRILKDAERDISGEGFDLVDHKRAVRFLDIYNIMKAHNDPGFKGEKATLLSKKTLDRLVKEIGEIELSNNKTVNEMGDLGAMAQLTIGPAKRGLAMYKALLGKLGKELKYPISVDAEGNVQGELIRSSNGKDMDAVNTYNRILQAMKDIGQATIRFRPEGTETTYEQLMETARRDLKIQESEMILRTNEYIQEHMEALNAEYGDKLIVVDPVGEPGKKNHYFEFFEQAMAVEAGDRINNILTNSSSKGSKDKQLTAALDEVFGIVDFDGKIRYAESIDDYKVVIENYRENTKDGTPERASYDNIVENLTVLRELFTARRDVVQISKKNAAAKSTIKEKDLDTLVNNWNEVWNTIPNTYKADWKANFQSLFLERHLDTKGFDKRAVQLTHYLIGNRLAELGTDKKLYMVSEEALIQELRDERGVNEKVINEFIKARKNIKAVMGDNIKETSYVPTEGASKYFDEVDLGKFINANKLLGNEILSDMMTKVSLVMKDVRTKNSGTRLRLKEIHAEITNLVDKLDPSTKIEEGFTPIDDINKIMGDIDIIIKLAKSESTKNDLNAIVLQLEASKKKIDSVTNKFKVGKKLIKNLIESEKVEGDEFGIHTILTRPIQKNLERIYTREQQGIDMVQELVVKMENLAFKGKSGLGLDTGQVTEVMENLAQNWYRTYKGAELKGSKVISELISEVNETGSFADAVKLIEGVNKEINRKIIIENKHHPLNNDAVKMMEALERSGNIDQHNRTVHEILNEYGLVDRNNKINEGFFNEVLRDPFKALDGFIKKHIYDRKDLDSKQKEKEWYKFRENDAIEILLNIENAAPIRKVKLMGVTEGLDRKSIAVFENEGSNINHPGTKYFEQNGLKVALVEETISVKAGGRLRNTSLDSFHNPMDVQKIINDAIRTNKASRDIIDAFKSMDPNLTDKMINSMLADTDGGGTPRDYLFYVRVSPKNKMIFMATEKNLKSLDKQFKDYYNKTLKRYEADNDIKSAAKFKELFKEIVRSDNDARHIVELKLMLPYLDKMGTRSELDAMIKEMARNNEGQVLAKIQANIFKRGFLSDGGTTQPLSKNVLKWIANKTQGHPKKEIRKIARDILNNDGYNSLTVNDGTLTFDIQNIVKNQLKTQLKDPSNSNFIRSVAESQLDAIDKGEMKSLENSTLDGAKFVSLRLMKMLMATKGNMKESFRDSPNGAKTIIFATGDNQMLGKGYAIYHPEVAKAMGDTDILIGTSAAKTLSGTSKHTNKLPVKPFEVPKSYKNSNWTDAIADAKANNRAKISQSEMILPIESLGVSFTSKNQDGVTISPSIFDFQSSVTVKDAIIWMQFNSKLEKLNTEWGNVHEDGGRLAQFLVDINKSEGNPLDKGDTGLTTMLLEYGAMPDNPLVTTAIRRLLRGRNFKQLSKSSHLHGGEDNFAAPDVFGELTAPTVAKLFNKQSGLKDGAIITDPVLRERVTLQYGGTALNKNTTKRLMGNSGKSANLEGEMFIIRNEHGVDEIVVMKNGKLNYSSSYYDNYNSNNHVFLDKNNKVLFEGGKPMAPEKKSDATKKQLNTFFKELNNLVNDYGLNYFETFQLLQGESLHKRKLGQNNAEKISLGGIQGIANKFKIQLGTFNHAIPAIGHDKVFNRVEKISNEMMGLMQMNVHDIRTVMQRDHDGDHVYTHTRLPLNILKEFAKENGRKSDFNMFNTSEVLNKEYINILGIDNNGIVGGNPEAVGFQKYASTLHRAKRTIGQVVGMRNALSWLGKTDFKIGDDLLLKDFVNKNENTDMMSGAWKFLDKFYDTIQNSVDIHNGIHDILRVESDLMDFLFFGKIESGMKNKLEQLVNDSKADLTFIRHALGGDLSQPGVIKNSVLSEKAQSKNFGEKRIEREIFYEILKTLRKVNMVQNDVWDEKGSRTPEPFEIRQAYFDINNFFNNPTDFLANRMLKRIYQINSYEEGGNAKARLLRNEYLDFFYGDSYKVTDPDARKRLYNDIIKGRADRALQAKFNFGNLKDVTMEDGKTLINNGWNMSTSGYVMSRLVTTRGFHDTNYDGIKNGSRSDFAKAGIFVRNIERFVDTMRMFEDPATFATSIQDMNIDITSFGTGAAPDVKSRINNGILRSLLQRQHHNLLNSLEYFSSQKYVDEYKAQKIRDRISNTQQAMDIMDVMITKNLVIDKATKDLQIIPGKGTNEINLNWLKKGQKVRIWRVKGDVQPIDRDPGNVFQFGVEGKRIDYKQLEPEGLFNKKGRIGPGKRRLFGRKGYTYIIDKNPVTMESISSNKLQYSKALFEATYGQEMNPSNFIKENLSDYRNEVDLLRKEISFDYHKTIKNALSNRVLSDDIFALDRAKDFSKISKFMKDWEGKVDSADPISVLIRHLIRPQYTPNHFWKNKDGIDMPVFKTNDHLLRMTLQWAENNGHQAKVKQLIQDWQAYIRGDAEAPDIGFYDRSLSDRYDWTRVPVPNSTRTLARHIGRFFASPILNAQLNKAIKVSSPPIKVIDKGDGKPTPYRKYTSTSEVKDNYFDYADTSHPGRTC